MKFSIGVPAYKKRFLKTCIDSILMQTYGDFELIIVNDASPDNLDEIVSSYSDNRIRYYKNEKNFGAENVVDNWNKCLSYASGDYFILMGDDDLLAKNYLETFDNPFKKYPNLGVHHCRSYIIDENDAIKRLTEPRPEFESVYDNILQRIKENRGNYISDFVFHTEILRLNQGFYKLPLAWASDDISSYVASAKTGIAHTDSPIFLYRENRINISSTGNVELKLDAIRKEHQWISNFTNEIPVDPIDKILARNIREELVKYTQKKMILTISSCINLANPVLFIQWLFKRKQYALSISEIIYCLMMSIKNKKVKKYETK